MRVIGRAAILGGTVGVAVALGTCAAAGAQAIRPATSIWTGHGIRVAASATPPNTDQYNAGYVGSTSSTGSLSGTVTVPTLKCKSKDTEVDYLAVFVDGTDASGDSTSAGADIYLTCDGGDTLSLNTDLNSNSSVSVSAGDVIQFSVSAGASSDTESYDDLTSGATASGSGTGFTPDLYQATIQGGYGDAGVFPGFTAIKFKSVMVDGATLSAAGPQRYDEVNAKGKKEIETSAIASKGTSFSEDFVTG